MTRRSDPLANLPQSDVPQRQGGDRATIGGRLAVALAIASAAGIFALVRLWPAGHRMMEERPTIVDEASVQGLQALPSPPDRANRESVRTQLDVRLQQALAAAGMGSATDLQTLAAERLSIVGTGDYEAFAASVKQACGRDVLHDSAVREEFEHLDRRFMSAKLGLDAIEVRPRTVNGEPKWEQQGGRLTSTNSYGRYAGEEGAKWVAREVWDVVIPVHFARYRGIKGEARFYLIHSYARRPDGAWVPYRSEIFDPSGAAPSLPTPWM